MTVRKYFFIGALLLSVGAYSLSREQQSYACENIALPAPDLSDAQFLGAKVGIRPYRKSGIRIEKEYLDSTLIIHNYGYGGSGLTLCWGGAEQALALLKEKGSDQKKVAVLGAGVIGLSTAYELAQQGYDVTIYADAFSPNITSDVAAGIWSPLSIKATDSAEKRMFIENMLATSRARFVTSAVADIPEFVGVQFIDDYVFKTEESGLTFFGSDFNEDKKLVRVFFDNGIEKTGTVKQILSINGTAFLSHLYEKVVALGVHIEERHFESVDDILSLEERIVMNCTSFGSETLFNDMDFLPIRGHMLLFTNINNLNYMAYENVGQDTSTWVTIYPRGDELLICGTLEEGERDATVDQEVVQMMLENVRSRFDPQEQPLLENEYAESDNYLGDV